MDRELAAIAVQQHGVVSAGQLLALGLSRGAIQRRLRSGRLHRLHRGVYAVGHPALSADGRAMAAVLACGPGAVLSHGSAAELWGLRRGSQSRWDVTSPAMSGGRSGPTTVRLHRTRRLDADDVTTFRNLPVTAVARTLVDLADILTPARLAAAIHEAEVQRVLDVRAVEEAAARAPGRRGAPVLRAALAPSEPPPSREAFVQAFVELCRRYRLPEPRSSVHVEAGGRLWEVDALFAAERLIVELDGEAVHGTRKMFHSDRRRDALLAAEGYQTLRYTWARVTREDADVARELHAVTARRRPR